MTRIINLDGQLAKVLLIPHVLVRLPGLLESEDPVVHHGLDPGRVDGLVHLLKLQPRPHQDAAHGADVVQAVEEARLVPAGAAEEADDGDGPLGPDGLERLRHRLGPAHFDHVRDPEAARRQALGRRAPALVGPVVDDVVRAEPPEHLGFGVGRRGRDDARAGRFGELQREHAHAARALRQDGVAGLQALALDAVQGVPGRQGRAGERAALLEV